MMMDAHFELFHNRLKLTKLQREDARAKYNRVSRSLYGEFYDGEYSDSTRLIFGSYGKRTQTRYPIGDVDLMFKIPKEDLERYQGYEGNGPSALLDRVRRKLQETYTTTDKIVSWGKVVLVEFPEGKHNIELLPGYEQADGTFLIPNTSDGGSWEVFDPRKELDMVRESNDSTAGITRKLIKFVKRWRNKSNAPIKSYQIEFFCVSYLDSEHLEDTPWSEIIEGFFKWLEMQAADLDEEAMSRISTANGRIQKARDYEIAEKFADSCIEWRKVFGVVFPVYDEHLATINNLEAKYVTANEEFIEERFPVKIDRKVSMKIVPKVKRNGFRDFQLFSHFFNEAIRHLPKKASLEFGINSSLGAKANYYWKIRNLSKEAQEANDLRGVIIPDQGKRLRHEGTKYNGTHYIECYAVVAGVCVAIARRFVPVLEET